MNNHRGLSSGKVVGIFSEKGHGWETLACIPLPLPDTFYPIGVRGSVGTHWAAVMPECSTKPRALSFPA